MERSQPKFESVSPIFTVRDISEALTFYTDKLGFEIGWTWGDPPTYANVCRDEIEMNLGLAARGAALATSGAYIIVANIDEYYDRLAGRGVTFEAPMADRDYGMRDFAVLDPSGNHLSFGQSIAPPIAFRQIMCALPSRSPPRTVAAGRDEWRQRSSTTSSSAPARPARRWRRGWARRPTGPCA